jgi:hypothetical protein
MIDSFSHANWATCFVRAASLSSHRSSADVLSSVSVSTSSCASCPELFQVAALQRHLRIDTAMARRSSAPSDKLTPRNLSLIRRLRRAVRAALGAACEQSC